MLYLSRPLFVLTFAALSTACSEPLVMLPGGALQGNEERPPAEWVGVPDTVQVEFRPATDPYSINVWAVGIGADVYIATGRDGTRWTEMLKEDAAVRLRIEDRIYAPLRAVPVADGEELLRVRGRYIEKYDVEPDSNMLDGALVYRLDR